MERTEELVPAFQRAVASGKPALIEVRTNPEQVTNRATIADLREQARKAAASVSAPEVAQPARAATPRRSGPRVR